MKPPLYAELAGLPLATVAPALGLRAGPSGSWGPCPCCGVERRGSEDARGPVGATGDGRAWRCHRCDAGGDAAALVLAVATGKSSSPGPDGWALAREVAERAALVDSAGNGPRERSGGPGGTPTRPPPGERSSGPIPAVLDPVADKPRAPADEVAELWHRCGEALDADADAWLRSRGLNPDAVVALDLARSWPREPGFTAPGWAGIRRRSWGDGWRLLFPTWGPAGELAGVRARWVDEAPPPSKRMKEVNGQDVLGGGAVYADPVGRWLLERGPSARPGDLVDGTRYAWSGAVVVCEGGPDWLTLATSPGRHKAPTAAALGLWAGAWSADFAARLPPGTTIRLALHADKAGRSYAEKLLRTLPRGMRVERVDLPEGVDVNDLHMAGTTVHVDAPGELVPGEEDVRDEDAVDGWEAGPPDWMADGPPPGKAKPEPVKLRPLRELAGPAFDRMEARGRGEESCLPVPWYDLAKVLDYDLAQTQGAPKDTDWSNLPALRPGVHVLVGGTGSGKTQLALSLALAAARAGHPVGYVGLELDPVGVVARLAALEWARRRIHQNAVHWSERWSAIDWPRGSVSQGALAKIRREVAEELAELPLDLAFGDARGGRLGFTADDFAKVADELAGRGTVQRPALVVLDFLQLLAADPKQPDDREIRTRIARAAYAASNATRDGRCAVVLVSATARDKYGALDGLELAKPLPDVRSMVGTGKESGEIEYAATSVLVMARCDDPDVRLVGVAKNRHGGTGWAALPWDGSAFYNVPGRLAATTAEKPAVQPAPPKKNAEAEGRATVPKVTLR